MTILYLDIAPASANRSASLRSRFLRRLVCSRLSSQYSPLLHFPFCCVRCIPAHGLSALQDSDNPIESSSVKTVARSASLPRYTQSSVIHQWSTLDGLSIAANWRQIISNELETSGHRLQPRIKLMKCIQPIFFFRERSFSCLFYLFISGTGEGQGNGVMGKRVYLLSCWRVIVKYKTKKYLERNRWWGGKEEMNSTQLYSVETLGRRRGKKNADNKKLKNL